MQILYSSVHCPGLMQANEWIENEAGKLELNPGHKLGQTII
jgi:hypothetical protein